MVVDEKRTFGVMYDKNDVNWFGLEAYFDT